MGAAALYVRGGVLVSVGSVVDVLSIGCQNGPGALQRGIMNLCQVG